MTVQNGVICRVHKMCKATQMHAPPPNVLFKRITAPVLLRSAQDHVGGSACLLSVWVGGHAQGK